MQHILPGKVGEPWVILVLVVAKELLLNYQNSSCLFCVSLAELVALRLGTSSGEHSCCLQMT